MIEEMVRRHSGDIHASIVYVRRQVADRPRPMGCIRWT